MELNKKIKISELAGIILGDGNLNRKSNCITIVGSLEDFYYFKNHVIPIITSLFNVNPKIRKRKDRNAFYIDFCSKYVMDYLSKKIGLSRGNKIDAKIPAFIKENTKLIPHFLRGLFDTDGCLKFSKQNADKNYYPRVRLTFKKSGFASEVEEVLIKSGFEYGKWEDKRGNVVVFYEISGKENLKKWMNIINPANVVHISKYLFWSKFGYCIPKSSLEERTKALNLNINKVSQSLPKADSF